MRTAGADEVPAVDVLCGSASPRSRRGDPLGPNAPGPRASATLGAPRGPSGCVLTRVACRHATRKPRPTTVESPATGHACGGTRVSIPAGQKCHPCTLLHMRVPPIANVSLPERRSPRPSFVGVCRSAATGVASARACSAPATQHSPELSPRSVVPFKTTDATRNRSPSFRSGAAPVHFGVGALSASRRASGAHSGYLRRRGVLYSGGGPAQKRCARSYRDHPTYFDGAF